MHFKAEAPAHAAVKAPSPAPAAAAEVLDVQHAYVENEGGSHVLVVPSANEIGVNVIVNIDDNSSEASSVQARLPPSECTLLMALRVFPALKRF